MAVLARRAGSTPAGWLRAGAIGASVLLMSGLVTVRSQSAFTDTTENSGNFVNTGTVALDDNDAGTALFKVNGMLTGAADTKCVQVTYSGTLTPPSPIAFYGSYVDAAAGDGGDSNTSADSALAQYLNLEVSVGAVGGTCATPGTLTPLATGATLKAFTDAHTSYATGTSTTWTPVLVTDMSRPFVIKLTLQDDNNAQGKTAEPVFTWEVRSS